MSEISLRPTATDDWELCLQEGDRLAVHRITLDQMVFLAECSTRIVLQKFAGLRRPGKE
jgi:hypothetical protein